MTKRAVKVMTIAEVIAAIGSVRHQLLLGTATSTQLDRQLFRIQEQLMFDYNLPLPEINTITK